MSSPPWDYIAKLVCIGDSGCGKSSLTIRLCEGRFTSNHDVTIGVEFGSRIVPVGPPNSLARRADAAASSRLLSNGGSSSSSAAEGLPEPPSTGPQKHMKLSLWDTAGQETFVPSLPAPAVLLTPSVQIQERDEVLFPRSVRGITGV